MSANCCVDTCNGALEFARGKGPDYDALVHVIEDCIKICLLREDFEKRNSELLPQVKVLCAEACSRCADWCEKKGDTELKDCVEECRSCCRNC